MRVMIDATDKRRENPTHHHRVQLRTALWRDPGSIAWGTLTEYQSRRLGSVKAAETYSSWIDPGRRVSLAALIKVVRTCATWQEVQEEDRRVSNVALKAKSMKDMNRRKPRRHGRSYSSRHARSGKRK